MLIMLPLAIATAGCQPAPATGPTSTARGTPDPTPATTASASTSPSATADGIEALIADLQAAGVPATLGSSFDASLLGGEGATVCVGPETIQVFSFLDNQAALAAAAKVDRDDPSVIGNAIVEWIGRPRFWLRDDLIALYLGDHAATDAALRRVLGQPFAELEGGRPPLAGPDCQ